MITFKQFLSEGGAATRALNTKPAKTADIKQVLSFLTKHTDLQKGYLENNLLGSAVDIFASRKRADGKTTAGDIDLAIDLTKFDKDVILKQVQNGLKADGQNPKFRQIGASVFSFAIPGVNSLVQLDLMFVPSSLWGKWAYHSPGNSKYSGAVRNILLMAAARNKLTPGKDIEVKNKDGETLIRVRKALKMDVGLERIFKIAPLRKDGTGRVKDLKKVTADEVEKEMQKLGVDAKISKDAENIANPDEVAALIFSPLVKAADLLTAEDVIVQIKKLENSNDIFKNAVFDLEKQKIEVPLELKKFK